MTTRVWLIRHGEPAAEARGRCYGALDIGLSPQGRMQMERVANRLAPEPLAAIYASPLRRAAESARILAAGRACAYEEDARLRELNFGDFEGRAYDELAAQHPDLYRQWMSAPTEVHFPNGESFSQMRARILQTFEAILRHRAGQTVAIVSHGGVNRILIAWALQVPDQCLFHLAQEYAAMNLLTWTGGVPTLHSMNATG